MLSPVVAYWVVSGFFHILDVYDLCSKYRLHTPAEVLKRNHVTRYEVFRDVIIQQIVQTVFGLLLAHFDPIETIGREEYDVAVWAQRLRLAQGYLPGLLGSVGLNSYPWDEGYSPAIPKLQERYLEESILPSRLHRGRSQLPIPSTGLAFNWSSSPRRS